MVIFAPIFQLGCLRASAGVTVFNSSRLLPKKGPPEQVRISRLISFLSPQPMRHWKIAECSESTGMISAWYFSASAITSSPAQTSVSLLARPMRLPARMAARVGFRPTMPTTAVMTQSAAGREAASRRPVSPHSTRMGRSRISADSSFAAASVAMTASSGLNSRHCSAMRCTLVPAVKAATFTSGRRLIISRLCRPMEPVEPRIVTHFTMALTSLPLNQRQNQQQRFHQGCYHGQGIEPVQHAAVTGNQIAIVLNTGLALDDGEAQVAEGARRRADDAV